MINKIIIAAILIIANVGNGKIYSQNQSRFSRINVHCSCIKKDESVYIRPIKNAILFLEEEPMKLQKNKDEYVIDIPIDKIGFYALYAEEDEKYKFFDPMLIIKPNDTIYLSYQCDTNNHFVNYKDINSNYILQNFWKEKNDFINKIFNNKFENYDLQKIDLLSNSLKKEYSMLKFKHKDNVNVFIYNSLLYMKIYIQIQYVLQNQNSDMSDIERLSKELMNASIDDSYYYHRSSVTSAIVNALTNLYDFNNPLDWNACYRKIIHLTYGIDRDYAVMMLVQQMAMMIPSTDTVAMEVFSKIVLDYKAQCFNANNYKVIESLFDRKINIGLNKLAPDFSLPSIDGDTIRLSSFFGKVIYINFWGTWCPPCVEDIPYLNSLQSHFPDTSIVFLNVAFDRNVEKWKSLIKKDSIKGYHVIASSREIFQDIEKKYQIYGFPRHILINRYGLIVNDQASGPQDGAKEEIEKLFE